MGVKGTMIAYKRLVYDDNAPRYPIVVSPVFVRPWVLKNGLMYYSIPPYETIEAGYGVHSLKSPTDPRLSSYAGDLVELQIGGTVVEGENGYRSSEASVTKVISNKKQFPFDTFSDDSVLLALLISFFEYVPESHMEYIVRRLLLHRRYRDIYILLNHYSARERLFRVVFPIATGDKSFTKWEKSTNTGDVIAREISIYGNGQW